MKEQLESVVLQMYRDGLRCSEAGAGVSIRETAGRYSRSAVIGGTLSDRGRGDVPRGLVVGDALFDPRHELRLVARYHLPDARPKFV